MPCQHQPSRSWTHHAFRNAAIPFETTRVPTNFSNSPGDTRNKHPFGLLSWFNLLTAHRPLKSRCGEFLSGSFATGHQITCLNHKHPTTFIPCLLAGLAMAALTATAGPAAEIFLINVLHLYQYSYPVFYGTPTWICWVYACGSVAVGNLGRKTMQILEHDGRL